MKPDWDWFEKRGLRAFPVAGTEGGVCRCASGKNCTSPGKHPRFKGWQDSAGTDAAYSRWRDGDNLGVATGKGLVVLDWDGTPTVPSSRTLRAATPSGGEHWYYTSLRPVKNGVKVFDGILDIRGEGGFVVVPPSLHVSGKRYRWIDEGDVTAPPAWVQRLLVTPKPKVERTLMAWPMEDPEEEGVLWEDLMDALMQELMDAPKGGRNQTLFRTACSVTEMICSGGLVRSRLQDVAYAARRAGLSDGEIKRTISSAVATVASRTDGQ